VLSISAKCREATSEHPDEAKVEYAITVVTSDRRFAGTDAAVSITLHGARGSTSVLALTPGVLDPQATHIVRSRGTEVDLFERGSHDSFRVRADSVGDVSAITLSHDGTGATPGWLPAEVQVRDCSTGAHWTFAAGRWLDSRQGDGATSRRLAASSAPDGGAQLPARDVSYTVKVATADERGAGTDADVHVVLQGARGSTGHVVLRHPAPGGNAHPDWFERGHTDVFEESAADVGAVEGVTVGHNSKGALRMQP
jgi:lipoxygenase homology domain-containing protein 1